MLVISCLPAAGFLSDPGASALTVGGTKLSWDWVFDQLIGVAERLLNSFGVFTRLQDGAFHVDIPLTGWRDF